MSVWPCQFPANLSLLICHRMRKYWHRAHVGTQHSWLFLLSGIFLNITPGQDTLYILDMDEHGT